MRRGSRTVSNATRKSGYGRRHSRRYRRRTAAGHCRRADSLNGNFAALRQTFSKRSSGRKVLKV